MDSQEKQNSTNETRKNYALSGVLKLAAAANVKIDPFTQRIYVEELWKFRPQDLHAGVQATIREWDKAAMMPTVQFVIERVVRCAKEAQLKIVKLPEAYPDFDPEQRKRDVEEILGKSKLRAFPGGAVHHEPGVSREQERERRRWELREMPASEHTAKQLTEEQHAERLRELGRQKEITESRDLESKHRHEISKIGEAEL